MLDFICEMAEGKKRKCCVKSSKIIQQKRWAASVVQLGTRSQRSGLKIIADEENLQSSKQTEVGPTDLRAIPATQLPTPFSFQYVCN